MSLLARVQPFPEGGVSAADIGYTARTYTATGLLNDPKIGGNDADVDLTFGSNGDLTVAFVGISNSGTPDSNDWHVDNILAGLGDDWEIRATLTSGTTPTNNAGLGTWLRLNSNRTWGNFRSQFSAGTTTSTLTFDFREFGGPGTILVTVTGTVIRAVI